MTSRVLIADDHEMVRRGLRSFLELSRSDIQVFEARDGQEAVEKTIDSKPHLVIMDVSMPRLDGFSAAKEIRKVSADIPILILTLEKSDTLAEVARGIGVSGFITKGESGDILLRAVDAALGGNGDKEREHGAEDPLATRVVLPKRFAPMEGDSSLARLENVASPMLRVLLLHSRVACVERCLRELKDVQFHIEIDVVLTPEQCAERLRTKHYDVVLAEYPTPQWQRTPAADLLRRSCRNIPLIFVTYKMDRDVAADLITNGAADCVEMDNLSQLPIAIRRALKENTFRKEHHQVEKKLQHSEARYRALTSNLAFGICRCGLEGQFVEVNAALATMLGYSAREDLFGLSLAADILHDPARRSQVLGEAGESGRIEPLETVWRRKDGTEIKVRLSGRQVNTDQGKRDGYELIVEDVSKQSEIEDQLRQQAARDPLTGLANYRNLQAVLDSEIRRYKRTGREFALLFFDLDKLKQINDRYGHLTGSDALCRLAEVLTAGCRSIDTAARFGGDEFAVVLPETGLDSANAVALRLCHNLANDGKSPKLSVSVGVAIYPTDGETVESLLLAADKALYRKKFELRNRVPVAY